MAIHQSRHDEEIMAPRLLPLTADEREQLRQALMDSDKQTQQLLGPLLVLEPVQHLLMTFLRDPNRSFIDHVWDPTTQGVLQRLRDEAADSQHLQADASTIFEQALLRNTSRGFAADNTPDFMAEVDAAQADGKAKFKRGDYYAAKNAFQKSLEALLKYHEDQYYGNVYPPHDWEEDDLRERYVTLCCNMAVCAIKLRDGAEIRKHANKALLVDERSTKALYALAKVNLMQQLFDEARSVVTKGIAYNPESDQFTKLQAEIDAAEMKQLEQQVELIAIKNLRDKLDEEEREKRAKQEEERQARLAKSVEVTPLPILHDDREPFQRLHTYFMRIKHELRVTIDPRHNPDNGEASLYECNIINGSTGMELATSVMASSKKTAKHEAAKLAIQKLWDTKQEAGTLLPEDQKHLDDYAEAQRKGKPFVVSAKVAGVQDTGANTSVVTDRDEDADGGPIKLTMYERQLDPVMLLNQLESQRRLRVDFEIEDVSPTKYETLFKATCLINGEPLAVTTAISKKKAKAEAGRKAMDVAFEKGIVEAIRSSYRDDEGSTETAAAAEMP